MYKFIFNSRLFLVCIIPLLLGCITTFSFQPYNFSIINFFVLPGLFFILSDINKRSKNTYRKKPFLINLFYVGYFFGVGFFLFGTYWISNSLKFDDNFRNLVPYTTVIIPLVLGIFYGLATLLCGRYLRLNFNSFLLFCFTFSLIDFIRAELFTGFPWNLWAYSWSWFVEILQILNPIGLFAFNLISVTFFLLPIVFFMKKIKYKNYIIILSIVLFFFNYLYGNYIINKNESETKKVLTENEYIYVKIISPSFDLKYNLSEEEALLRINQLIKYSDAEKDKKTLFIWPEGSLSGKYFLDFEKYKELINKNFSKEHLIVLGSNTLNKKKGEFYNSFIIIDHKLNKKFQYDKIKLVPFGEFLPFSSFFQNIGLKKITEGIGSFSKGEIRYKFLYDKVTLVPLICYEIIFPDLIQNIESKNNLLINISEDAWFGDSIGPYQHFSKSIFRAIESDAYVARSTNKGISAIISNKGKVIKSLKNNETGNIEYKLPILEKKGGNKNDLIFFVLLFTYGFIFLILKKNE